MSFENFESWHEEKQSAFLYRVLAAREKGTPRERLFLELAAMAEKQADVWVKSSGASAADLPAFSPNVRVRAVSFLVQRLGPKPIKLILASMKIRGLSVYSSHEPELAPHAMPRDVSDLGGRHRLKGSSGSIRAAIFGINDGLVSTASLMMAVAGAAAGDTRIILLSGAAGLFAGAMSMASGEYLSVRSQRELLEYQLDLERAELEQYPEEEAAELALIYAARGIPVEQASDIARKLIADPERALDTLAREELGLDPNDLGSPWGAAISSFVAFAVGGAAPLLPFLLSAGHGALRASIIVTGLALFVTGAVVSLFSGRGFLFGGIRMLLIGGGAGATAYFLGTIAG